ncbi:hypothetical protein ABT039_22820 [Streptomyces lasiicapitis]|uniref:hypothetical protein n=1 Tax=Streptomyces lasiicapitis TaxID=1923961 RepID=UPI0033206085
MTTTPTASAAAVPMTKSAAPTTAAEKHHEPGETPLSRGAAIFVIVVAFIGTVLATIDAFINGWLAALAHLGWVVTVFLVISLFLGTFLGFILGGRQANSGDAPAPAPGP